MSNPRHAAPSAVFRRARRAAGRMARLAGPDRLRRARSPRWRRGRRRSPRATRPSASGSSSTRRSTPPARAPGTRDLLDPRFPVHRAGRGGQFTYHGPGQRVAYVMLDLKRRRPDVRAYVAALEGWLIGALAAFGVAGETREDRVGVWVARPDKPRAPTARRRGQDRGDRRPGAPLGDVPRRRAQRRARPVAFLRHHAMRDPRAHYGVTSLADLGRAATMAEVDAALRASSRRRSGRRSTSTSARRRPPPGLSRDGLPPSPLARRAFWPRPMRVAGSGPNARRRSRRFTTRSSASASATGRTASSIRASIASARASARATGDLLGHCLARPDAPAPSAEFDPAWYAAQNPDWRATHPHPLPAFPRGRPRARTASAGRHRHGLRARRDPRQGPVDGGGRDAGLRSQAARRRHEASAVPGGASARGRTASTPTAACGSSARPGRPAAAGSSTSSADAASTRPGSTSRAITTCCSITIRRPRPNPRADAVVVQAGTKTTAIRRLLAERPDFLLRYEAVLFLDDDVELGAADIEALFAAMAREARSRAARADRRFRMRLCRSSSGPTRRRASSGSRPSRSWRR